MGDTTCNEMIEGGGEEDLVIEAEESDLFQSLARLERESFAKDEDSFELGDETLKDVESMELEDLAVIPDENREMTAGKACYEQTPLVCESFHNNPLFFVPPDSECVDDVHVANEEIPRGSDTPLDVS